MSQIVDLAKLAGKTEKPEDPNKKRGCWAMWGYYGEPDLEKCFEVVGGVSPKRLTQTAKLLLVGIAEGKFVVVRKTK